MFFPLNIIPRIFCLTGNDILKYIYTIQWNMISYIYIYPILFGQPNVAQMNYLFLIKIG